MTTRARRRRDRTRAAAQGRRDVLTDARARVAAGEPLLCLEIGPAGMLVACLRAESRRTEPWLSEPWAPDRTEDPQAVTCPDCLRRMMDGRAADATAFAFAFSAAASD